MRVFENKKLIRRILMVFCVTLFALVFGMGVYAGVGQKTKVYHIEFPRSGDSNAYGAWGQKTLNYMNGWSGVAYKRTILRTIGGYSGNIAYCIEPGTDQVSGNMLTEKNENFFNELPSSYNSTISPVQVRSLIGRILEYGYCGKVSTSWKSQNYDDANHIAHAIATQVLIWESVVGERDGEFHHVDTGGYDPVLSAISTSHPLYDKIMSYYDDIVNKVQQHSILPSFCAADEGSAPVQGMEWDGEKYSVTLEDENEVLSQFRFYSSGNVDLLIAGDYLTISSDEPPTEETTVWGIRDDLTRKGTVVWSDGIYKPGYGIQDVVSYAQEISESMEGYLKVKVEGGTCKIIKTSEDGQVEGIRFLIEGEKQNETCATNAKGEIVVSGLLPGEYKVTELEEDAYIPGESQTILVEAGKIATVHFENKLKRGNLRVEKEAEDGVKEGFIFRLSGESLSGEEVDERRTTDENGMAVFEDIPISGKEAYVLEEIDTPVRYVISEKNNVEVKWGEETLVPVENLLKKFHVVVKKEDAETKEAQGDASLAGAKYGVYKGEILIDTYETDNSGTFTTKEYICGPDWTIRELVPSEGYLLDKTSYKIGKEAGEYTEEINEETLTVKETVQKGSFALIKHSDEGKTGIDTPEKDAEFDIFLKTSGTYEDADDPQRDHLICDENGYAKSKDLPYGVYVVAQTSGREGAKMVEPFDVFISKNGQVYRYLLNNAPLESYIKIVKKDKETGLTIPGAGAGYQIYSPDGEKITQTFAYPKLETIDTFYTDDTGTLITPEQLSYAKGYCLVEVQAPYGYVLDPVPVYFDVTKEGMTTQNGQNVIVVEQSDVAQKGIISLEKKGEVFDDVQIVETLEGTIYQPVYRIKGLEGAVYEVRASEDIYTEDGSLRYSKGQVVDEITTKEGGHGESAPLYLGTYEVKETKAPLGMALDDNSYTVKLTYQDQMIRVETVEKEVYDQRRQAKIELIKELEQDENYQIGNNEEMSHVKFGFYATKDVISCSGNKIPADGLIEILYPDKDGKASLTTSLPYGSYYIKELECDEHYRLSEDIYPIELNETDGETDQIEIKVNEGNPVENELIRGCVKGEKVNESKEGLPEAIIGIFPLEAKDFTIEDSLAYTKSDEEGNFTFEGVPFGKWIVKEIRQPEGYALNEESYVIEITKEEETVELEIVNRPVRGKICLTKVDEDYPDHKLTQAEFEVYLDLNENGKVDEEDNFYGNLQEVEKGIYTLEDLAYGTYLVRETKAPEGYLLDEGVYSVKVETDKKVYEVENNAGIGFVNQPKKGRLQIDKTSSDGKVEGFAFHITGPNGYDVVYQTDQKGQIILENLRIGEYQIEEVLNEASMDYVRPEKKTVLIEEDTSVVVKMHNEKKDRPATGDTGRIVVWSILSILLLGLVAALAYLHKKIQDSMLSN